MGHDGGLAQLHQGGGNGGLDDGAVLDAQGFGHDEGGGRLAGILAGAVQCAIILVMAKPYPAAVALEQASVLPIGRDRVPEPRRRLDL